MNDRTARSHDSTARGRAAQREFEQAQAEVALKVANKKGNLLEVAHDKLVQELGRKKPTDIAETQLQPVAKILLNLMNQIVELAKSERKNAERLSIVHENTQTPLAINAILDHLQKLTSQDNDQITWFYAFWNKVLSKGALPGTLGWTEQGKYIKKLRETPILSIVNELICSNKSEQDAFKQFLFELYRETKR